MRTGDDDLFSGLDDGAGVWRGPEPPACPVRAALPGLARAAAGLYDPQAGNRLVGDTLTYLGAADRLGEWWREFFRATYLSAGDDDDDDGQGE